MTRLIGSVKGGVHIATRSALLAWTTAVVLACGGEARKTIDPGECSDAGVLARLSQCDAATDETSCSAAQGTWVTDAWIPYCSCPTGQEGCSCTSASQCRGECIGAHDVSDCSGITVGHCASASVTQGCFCRFDETGAVKAICIN